MTTYAVATTDHRGRPTDRVSTGHESPTQVKCGLYNATSLGCRFAVIEESTGQIVSRWTYDYNERTKRYELRRKSNRREGQKP